MLIIVAVGFAVGAPIFLSIGMSTLLYVADVGPNILRIFMQRLFSATTSFSFIAVPLFMLAGSIMGLTGITDRLIAFCNSLVGWMRGGLAQVNVVTSIFFAGISGSALADTAGLGSVLIPAMEKEGYSRGFAGAVTAASATIGPIIPPSIIIVIYGSTFGVSIGALFAAALLPGLLLGFSQMILVYYLSIKNDFPCGKVRPSFKMIGSSFFRAWTALVMPLIILGGIFGGIFTATEASAIAVFYAMIIGAFYRKLTLKKLYVLFRDVALTVSGILIILAVAQNFAWIITRKQLPQLIVRQLVNITENHFLLIIVILVVLLVAGMFVERAVAIFMLTPILLPILTVQIGLGPLQAALMLIFTLGIGHITPPFGGTLYVACMVGKIPMEDILRHVLPFIFGMVIVTLVIAFWPPLTEWFPAFLGLGMGR